MATEFSLRLVHPDPAYARHAAAELFVELDGLEAKLSRFIEGSDVSRINRLRAGECGVVSLETFECLYLALAVWRETGGAFDVAFRSTSANRWPEARFELVPEQRGVRSLVEGLTLDLGAIGKGYALDRLALLLEEWDIGSALLCASTSTILALDPPPGVAGWHAQIGTDSRIVHLNRRALSASGKAVKGEHIVDPRTGLPAGAAVRTWCLAQSAAESDALSTAFMVMEEAQVRAFCARHASFSACVAKTSGRHSVLINAWPTAAA